MVSNEEAEPIVTANAAHAAWLSLKRSAKEHEALALQTAYTVIFASSALLGLIGPVGHHEPSGSAVYVPLFIVSLGMVALFGRFPKLSVHLAWLSVCVASVLFVYRMYRYEKQNASIYLSSLHEERKK